jgi:glycine cleavage system aminomethyltransferase T
MNTDSFHVSKSANSLEDVRLLPCDLRNAAVLSGMSEIQVTPLNAFHRRHGGRMVDFAGWDMPVQYKSILEEHKAVRQRAGLFDVSHMGEAEVKGPEALKFLQHLVSNDCSKLFPWSRAVHRDVLSAWRRGG